MGYIHEEWSIDSVIFGGLNFLIVAAGKDIWNIVKVLLRDHGELGGCINCWREWKWAVVSVRTQLFGNHKSVWNEHVSLSDQGLRSLLCSPRSSVFWEWKRARWLMYLSIEYGTGCSKILVEVVTRFIVVSIVEPGLTGRWIRGSYVFCCQGCWKAQKSTPTLSIYLHEPEFL